jgi:hypothetical protein
MDFSEINFIKLIKSFSKHEILEFEKFICSPYFNTQSALSKIYNQLIVFYPDFNSVDLTKANIYKAVFPEKEFNDILFRKYISNLMKLAEDFLVCKDLTLNEERRMTCLLDQYDKRQLTSFFEKQLKKTESNISENAKINVETFYYKHFREELKTNYFTRINKLHMIKNCIIKSHIYILLHMLLTGTVYTNIMLIVQKSFRDSDGDNDYFEKFNNVFDIIKYLENINDLEEIDKIFISLCKIDIELFKDPSSIDKLRKMKEIIFKMADMLSNNLLYTFFSHLNIYYLINIKGNLEVLNRDLFDNYNFMIERGLYISDEREFINFSEYRTILLNSLRLKELEWAEKFIEQFKDYHDPVLKENMHIYSRALLCFEKKDFESSLNLISKLKVQDMIIKMDADITLLLIYYEKDYIDNALSLIDSFRHYMLENKILSKDVIINHIDFLRFYRFLLMNKNNFNNSPEFERIRSEIQNHDNLRRKIWLVEKMEELIVNR